MIRCVSLAAALCLLFASASAEGSPSWRARLATAAGAGDANVVDLSVQGGSRGTVRLTIEAPHPAHYLKHRLGRVVRMLDHATKVRLTVRDSRGLVLRWRLTKGMNPNHGSLDVRPGLERCSPIVAIGWPSHLPPCPSG